ncbi:hypothetical protein [Spirosoma sp.]|uniref:hypothetical protein n=1 Tax=Spirosoma sp. TaxID=1899569 RepID=UPI0026240830|nr:hypothetical protein [Spirosoma sp.]MCX6217611.1 hypothetical protein [Spirosoma sp.]
MNSFDNFFRFFTLADNAAARPLNQNLPATAYPNLPVVPGDKLRWLVPKADCGGVNPNYLTIGIRPKGATDAGTLCGRLRKQAGATYTEIRLRVDSPPTPDTYRQFALMAGDKNVLSTFRGQQTDLDEYLNALQEHFRCYPYALVDCDRTGSELRIRLYPNERVSLHGETIRVGLGTVEEKNTNSPSLMSGRRAAIAMAALDTYNLSVSPDIQEGNIFVFDTVSYTASGTESPDDILSALGVPTGSFSRTGGINVSAYTQPGTIAVTNTNRPTLQLLYVTTSGGNDLYTAVVSSDVLPGNVYQISAPGLTTRTVTATASDTKATIEAQFNTSAGRTALPAGTVYAAIAVVGSQTISNSNNPVLTLTKTSSLAARTSDLYTIYVGSSVVEGNRFELINNGVVTAVTATETDTPDTIAQALGYSSNPFTLEVTPGTVVTALARRGPRYHEPANLANITLLSAQTAARLPYVAEVSIPALSPGDYQFVLRQGIQPVGVSNYVHVKPDTKDTALMRFGPLKPSVVFGSAYSEDGLMQQIRLPIYIDKPRRKESETLYTTLDSKTTRGRTMATRRTTLTTTLQDTAFQDNLYRALKHPCLYIDGVAYRCEGEVSQTEPTGRRRRTQATADLMLLDMLDYRPSLAADLSYESGLYAIIYSVLGMDGLWIAAKRLRFVEPIAEGVALPAADYDLLIRTGGVSQRLTISQDDERVATFSLIAGRLNKVGPVRLSPGRISLKAEELTVSALTTTIDAYNPQQAETDSTTAYSTNRPGDFSPDFSTDFSH